MCEFCGCFEDKERDIFSYILVSKHEFVNIPSDKANELIYFCFENDNTDIVKQSFILGI